MDADAQRVERQRALEEKRMKLEKLKREREERSRAQADESRVGPPTEPKENIANVSTRAEVDDLVSSLLGDSKTKPTVPATSPAEGSSFPAAIITTASSSSGASEHTSALLSEKLARLSFVSAVVHIDILPREREAYEKEVQTDAIDFGDNLESPSFGALDVGRMSLTPMKGSGAAHWRRQKLTVGPGNSATSQASPTKTNFALSFGSTSLSTPSKAHQDSPDTHEMSAEELERIQVSEPFGSFMELAGRRMERALAQSASSFDILHSYTRSGNDSVRRTSESQILSDLACFECDISKSRPVMDIQVSPHTASQQGLFLVAYGAAGQAKGWQGAVGGHSSFLSSDVGGSDDSAGVVCLWQAALPMSPEKRLVASSPVMAAQFHAEDQNLVIGGCHNGQVLLWDLRSSSPHPVQRSNLAGKGHRHPVTSIMAVSSAAAYELVSVSSDGQICHWDVQRLSDPVTSTFATTTASASGSVPTDSTSSSSIAINVSCTVLGLGEGEASKEMMVGAENGKVYRLAVPYRPVDSVRQGNAHQGMVSSMQRHPGSGKVYKDLLLTSSLDWTVKLWNLASPVGFENPLLELVSVTYDYVCDVRWSPTNPAVFCTITSGGMLTLWDLSKSTLEAQDYFNVLKDSPSSASSGASSIALNKLAWSLDGSSLYVGDTRGSVRHISVKETSARPRPGDDARVEIALMQSSNNNKIDMIKATEDGFSSISTFETGLSGGSDGRSSTTF